MTAHSAERRLPSSGLPGEDAQAERFSRAREAQATALTEDYVELIADLIGDGGEAGGGLARRHRAPAQPVEPRGQRRDATVVAGHDQHPGVQYSQCGLQKVIARDERLVKKEP